MERIEIPPEEKTIHFSFPQPKASGRIVAEFEDVAKSYAGKNGAAQKEVFRDVSFMIERGARILDDLGSLSARSTETELRSLLGCFLFSHDDVFKKIGVLSGGERGRYALLRLLLHPANFLLLDEPTNHLDLRAKDVL